MPFKHQGCWLQQCQFFCLSFNTKSRLLKIQKQGPLRGKFRDLERYKVVPQTK